jgi:hypothetical protein
MMHELRASRVIRKDHAPAKIQSANRFDLKQLALWPEFDRCVCEREKIAAAIRSCRRVA